MEATRNPTDSFQTENALSSLSDALDRDHDRFVVPLAVDEVFVETPDHERLLPVHHLEPALLAVRPDARAAAFERVAVGVGCGLNAEPDRPRLPPVLLLLDPEPESLCSCDRFHQVR